MKKHANGYKICYKAETLLRNKIKSKIINDCVINLKHVSEENNLNLVWISGHEGFFGNERMGHWQSEE